MGIAGLGTMGAGIAPRLRGADFAGVGWKRTEGRAQGRVEAGMGGADTPRELAGSVDVNWTMLTDAAAVAGWRAPGPSSDAAIEVGFPPGMAGEMASEPDKVAARRPKREQTANADDPAPIVTPRFGKPKEPPL